MNNKQREAELAGRARDYIERAQRRVRVVANATSTEPERGAHLAFPTSLNGAANARSCIRHAREQHRSRGAPEACNATQRRPRNKVAKAIIMHISVLCKFVQFKRN